MKVKQLKRGSFGSVLLAEDRQSGEVVALKLLPRSQGAGDMASEVLNQLRLHHPHVITLREAFLTEEHLVLAMDYAAGGDLAAHVPPGRGLPEPQARWLFQQLAFALDYCHRMGVASRDVKLENILIHQPDVFPIIRLADFGLSTCERYAQQAVGTPRYMPPEVLRCAAGGPPYDTLKADLWSCGVVLYSLLTGDSPFQRPEDAQLGGSRQCTRAILHRIRALDFQLPPWLPHSCRDLLAALLSPDPAARPSMADVLRHPWCAEGICPEQMLRINDGFIELCLAHPPTTELLERVSELLKEASLEPSTPPAAALAPAKKPRFPRHGDWEGSSDCGA